MRWGCHRPFANREYLPPLSALAACLFWFADPPSRLPPRRASAASPPARWPRAADLRRDRLCEKHAHAQPSQDNVSRRFSPIIMCVPARVCKVWRKIKSAHLGSVMRRSAPKQWCRPSASHACEASLRSQSKLLRHLIAARVGPSRRTSGSAPSSLVAIRWLWRAVASRSAEEFLAVARAQQHLLSLLS